MARSTKESEAAILEASFSFFTSFSGRRIFQCKSLSKHEASIKHTVDRV